MSLVITINKSWTVLQVEEKQAFFFFLKPRSEFSGLWFSTSSLDSSQLEEWRGITGRDKHTKSLSVLESVTARIASWATSVTPRMSCLPCLRDRVSSSICLLTSTVPTRQGLPHNGHLIKMCPFGFYPMWREWLVWEVQFSLCFKEFKIVYMSIQITKPVPKCPWGPSHLNISTLVTKRSLSLNENSSI